MSVPQRVNKFAHMEEKNDNSLIICPFCGEHGHSRPSSRNCKRHFEVAASKESHERKGAGMRYIPITAIEPNAQGMTTSATDNQTGMKPPPQEKDFLVAKPLCKFCGEHGHSCRSSRNCKRHVNVVVTEGCRRTKKNEHC